MDNSNLKQKIHYIQELEHIREQLTERRFSLVFSHIAFWSIEEIESEKMLFVFDRAKELFGLTKNLFTKEEFIELFIPENRAKLTKLLEKLLQENSSFEGEGVLLVNNEPRNIFIKCETTTTPSGKIEALGHLQDITEIKYLQKAIQSISRSLKQYLTLLEEHIITVEINIDGKISEISEAMSELSKIPKEEYIGKNLFDIFTDDTDEKQLENLWKTLGKGQMIREEFCYKKRKKDETFWLQSIFSPIFNEEGSIVKYILFGQDISNKKSLEELSITDALTGIHNRRYFNEIIRRELKRERRDGKYLTFIMMDVDHFKQYNDTYGHLEGDNVLANIGKILKDSLKRGSDFVFRLGGEEFGIIFSDVESEQSLNFAEKIRCDIEALQIPHSKNSAAPYVTASFGMMVTDLSKDIIDEHALYTRVDQTLYKAKESGRNRVMLYEEEELELF